MLRAKTNNLEEVDEQRKFIEGLPNKIAELMQDIEATKVGAIARVWVVLRPL